MKLRLFIVPTSSVHARQNFDAKIRDVDAVIKKIKKAVV